MDVGWGGLVCKGMGRHSHPQLDFRAAEKLRGEKKSVIIFRLASLIFLPGCMQLAPLGPVAAIGYAKGRV